jgi:hypothetical protein
MVAARRISMLKIDHIVSYCENVKKCKGFILITLCKMTLIR